VDRALTEADPDRHCLDSADLANFKPPRRVVFVTPSAGATSHAVAAS
jgi:hypothetical protein